MQNDPLKADFRNFLYLVWQHLNLPDPTPTQYELAQYLQHGPKRAMIQAFRGVGKSYVTSAFVCWLLYCDPKINVMVVSASKDRSDNFTIFTKRLIEEMPLLSFLKPKAGQRDSMIAFDVGPAGISHSPSVKSVGITGQLTGSRADVIIADDIESLNNSLTQVMRDQLAERIKEFDAVLKPLQTSRIIYLGTPQSEMSLYNQLPERGYVIRVWPARVPEKPEKYMGRLAPSIYAMIEKGVPVGTPTDPARFPEHELQERALSYGRSGFALQFMLDTSLSDQDRYPLKLSDLIVMNLDPKLGPAKLAWCNEPDKMHQQLHSVGLAGDRYYRPLFISPEMTEYTGCVMAIDPSGRGKDETGYAIVKILHGNLFLVDAGGFADGYGENTLKALAVLAKQYGVNTIRVEPNFGDGMFAQLLRPVVSKIHPVEVVDDERSTGQKEMRIADVLEPLMNQHRLVVDAKLIEKDYKSGEPANQLFYQMTRLTRDRGSLKHDDRLDAVAQACAYWIDSLSRDTDRAHEEHLERLRDQELEKFMRSVLGDSHVDDQDRWMRV
jgi:hypothetical protein